MRRTGGAAADDAALPELAARAAALSVCERQLSALARVAALAQEADASLADAQRSGDAAERHGHIGAAVDAFCAAAEAVRCSATERTPPHD